jgi:signal transduction histidine kinase
LIGDLLTLARSDSGKLDLELRGVNFSEIVQAAVEEMRVMAEAKELRLILDIANPCSIRGDGRSLHRLVCILLDNAIKFSTKSTAIRVTLASGTRTLLSVSDEGPGIPAAELECIFERFYRVSKDRSRMNGGAGLGLSIARSIVEMHAGIIKAESILGKGSTFTVSLPSN